MIIVADTTPISELAKVNYLNLLPKLFGRIAIPQGVYDELTTGQHPAALLMRELSWLDVVAVNNRLTVKELQQVGSLDLGESEAIALAEEMKADRLIIDEKAARRVAMARSLPLIGTMGVLLLGKRQGELENVKDVLDQMQQQGTRIKDHLYTQVLILAQEMSA
jgi:predicted nucleic acid-binding protein